MKTLAFTVLLVGCILDVGCVSPESTRVRGGRGADVGNRPAVAEMHAGAEPFWKTPRRVASYPEQQNRQ